MSYQRLIYVRLQEIQFCKVVLKKLLKRIGWARIIKQLMVLIIWSEFVLNHFLKLMRRQIFQTSDFYIEKILSRQNSKIWRF